MLKVEIDWCIKREEGLLEKTETKLVRKEGQIVSRIVLQVVKFYTVERRERLRCKKNSFTSSYILHRRKIKIVFHYGVKFNYL